MALKKSKTINGVTGEYWMISDKNYCKASNSTVVSFKCFVNSEIRATGVNNFISIPEFSQVKVFEGDLDLEECYIQSKVSALVDEVETNFFADAEDC